MRLDDRMDQIEVSGRYVFTAQVTEYPRDDVGLLDPRNHPEACRSQFRRPLQKVPYPYYP
jgi:hypothetical protein